MNHQLAGMLKSGIPLEPALRQTCPGMRRGKFRAEFEALEAGLSRGTLLNEALAGRQLPEFYNQMARVGVESNNLSAILTMLGGYYQKTHIIWPPVFGRGSGSTLAARPRIGGPDCATGFFTLSRGGGGASSGISAPCFLLCLRGNAEPAAVTLAAEATANNIFIKHARRAVRDLAAGQPLQTALRRFDKAGEFQWRLANAAAQQGGFRPALEGWMESLDARAFQQQQTASQIAITGLVLWNGLRPD
ncbi:MAG TPA: type II secretion system F family protein [Verrucomicrobiae bacterium]